MSAKEWLLRRIKKAGENIESAITQWVLGVVGLGIAGFIAIYYPKALSFVYQVAIEKTPVWLSIVLFAICCIYIYLKTHQIKSPQRPPKSEEVLQEAFGVYWTEQYKLRCLKCKWPLKCASKVYDPSIFWCSNCNEKFALRDTNGDPLTEARAIDALKSLVPTG